MPCQNSPDLNDTEDLDISLGSFEKAERLPWTTLPKILSEHGWELENWPGEVPLPGSGSQLCDDNKGINGLDMASLSMLYAAVKCEDHPLKFRKIAIAQSISGAPLTGCQQDATH